MSDDWREKQRWMSGEAVYRVYTEVIGSLRIASRDKGYAIASHGSLRRDIDLIAVPWTDNACDPNELVKHLALVIGASIEVTDLESGALKVTDKPHGRMGVRLHPGETGVYIDLSIMPRGSRLITGALRDCPRCKGTASATTHSSPACVGITAIDAETIQRVKALTKTGYARMPHYSDFEMGCIEGRNKVLAELSAMLGET